MRFGSNRESDYFSPLLTGGYNFVNRLELFTISTYSDRHPDGVEWPLYGLNRFRLPPQGGIKNPRRLKGDTLHGQKRRLETFVKGIIHGLHR